MQDQQQQIQAPPNLASAPLQPPPIGGSAGVGVTPGNLYVPQPLGSVDNYSSNSSGVVNQQMQQQQPSVIQCPAVKYADFQQQQQYQQQQQQQQYMQQLMYYQQQQQYQQQQLLHQQQQIQQTQQEQDDIKQLQNQKNKENEKAKQKEKEKQIPVCDLHPKGFSKNCRQCKKIKDTYNIGDSNKEEDNQELAENIKFSNGKDENIFKIAGNGSTGNLNPRLQNAILQNEYFKNLYNLKTFHEVIDEITKSASHAQPWALGSTGIPSSFFCCLYKFMTMRLTVKQVKNLIDYKLNPIVRLAGFLYIRFCCDPEYIWAWLRRYLLDDEICYPQTVSSIQMTIGEYVESLLMNLDYHNTRLPRIPNKIDNKIQAKLVLTQEKRDRKTKNLLQFNKFTKEAKVMAISRIDDEWHVGQIQSVSGKSVIVRFFDEQAHSGRPFFQGGEELVNLGEVDLIENTEALPQSTTFSQKNQSDYKNGDGEVANTKRKSKSRSKSHSRNRKKKHKRGSQSRSSSSHSSHRKDKKHRKKHSSKHHSKKDKKKSRRRSRSSSYSSSRSRSNSREKRRQKSRSIESHRKKEEIQLPRETNKEREQRYIEQLKKKQAESSVAYNRAEVARVPSSYKTALSGQFTTNVLFDRTKYDSSPRRDTQFIEISKPKVKQTVKEEAQKQQPSEKFLEQQAKIIQKYGAYSSDQAGGNRDYV